MRVISGLDDPLGLAWLHGSLYVASVGRVDAYSGFDGRRFASHREIIDGPLAGGENNGLVMAPDGRFVMGITASCDHCTPVSRSGQARSSPSCPTAAACACMRRACGLRSGSPTSPAPATCS